MSDYIKEKGVGFTGHRELQDETLILYKLDEVVSDLIFNGYERFFAGGAKGFDMLAAESVIMNKKKYPNVKPDIIHPYKDYTKYWDSNCVSRFNKICENADKVEYISDTYWRGCIQKRNRELMNRSSICVCYLIKKCGGTAYTVECARKKQIQIINLFE